MNYLVSILFVLACVSFSTQDNGTLVDKKENVEININDKPTTIPGTISDNVPPQPKPRPPPANSTTIPTPTTPPKPTPTTPPKPTPTTSTKPTPTNATTIAPNSTTIAPTTPKPSTTTAKSNTTTATPITVAPTTAKPAPEPEPHRRFDGPSFIGGIVLALGLCAIGFVGFKFYKARLEVNYHTL